MMRLIVMYYDGEVLTYLGESFQHGDKALTLMTNKGRVFVPLTGVRVYEIQKVEEEEHDCQDVVEPEVSATDSTGKDKGDPSKEEV